MTITADTNVLVRAILEDDPGKVRLLRLSWLEPKRLPWRYRRFANSSGSYRRGYGIPLPPIADIIRRLIDGGQRPGEPAGGGGWAGRGWRLR